MSSLPHEAAKPAVEPSPAARAWRPGIAAGYAIAIVGVAAATWLRSVFDPWLGDNLPYTSFILAVLFVAWTTRLGPSLLAFFLGVWAADFFFVSPRYVLMARLGDFEAQLDLVRYLLVSSAIILACQAMRASRSRAEAATDRALDAQRRLEAEVAERMRAQEALQAANEQLEQRVAQRTAELVGANQSLQRSNRELEQFASVASHDLQEPLRKVQAFGDRLQAKCAAGLGEQGRDYLERILSAAARMRTLIDDLLAFSRITTKAQPFVPVDLDAIARGAVADLEGRILQTSGAVELEALPGIEADPLQMQQLFLNLIGNGLKFHRPQVAPVVRVSARSLPDAGSGERCEISFEDNGIGFEMQYLDRIFEVFQRLHGRNEYEGTGIGLAICRKIVERHGGQITARSAPGEGATFVINLPRHPPKSEPEQ